MTTMNRVREYVEKLSFEELHQIVDEWEKWEQSGVTAKDSPMRVHAVKAWPEMDESSYIVQRMRDVSFEVFRRFFYETPPNLPENQRKDLLWKPGDRHRSIDTDPKVTDDDDA